MKLFKIMALAALVLLPGAAPAAAKVDVVTANQDLAWVTGAVGGGHVSVDYLAASGQDPHLIEPRPSQVVKLARAKMVVSIGMDLDIWFGSLIRAAGNGGILTGARGFVDASRGIHVLQVPQGKLDPSRGDIHIYGNPHYLLAPSNLRIVARNITDGLKRVDSSNSAAYEGNYASLMTRLNQALPGWKAKLAGARGKGVVTYHQSLIYFLSEFGLKEAGNVEPRPGLEPTPGHVTALARDMKQDGVKVILTESYRPRRFSDLLARESGAKLVIIPGGVGGEKGIGDYFALISAIVDRVAAAL